MSNSIIRFPPSKRCLTKEELYNIKVCTNKIHNVYSNTNPFITNTTKKDDVETLIAELIKTLYEMNEEQ